MKKTVLVLALFVPGATVLAKQTGANVEFVQGQGKVDVLIGGKHFTSYVYGDALPKPMLVPLRSPSGIAITRRHPLVEIKGGSMDHRHHVGIFFAVDRVNGTNFWNYYRNPGGATPQIKHIKVLQTACVNGTGKLVTAAHWIDKRGKFLLGEKRSMVFMAGERKDEWTLDFSLDLTAQKEKVVFEDIEEGVFAIRVSDYLREGEAKGGVRPGRAVPGESVSGTGRYFSSNGDETAKNVWGKRARWVALQGVREGKVVGVAILNHPESINYPTYWHVRDYGLFSANPLGQGDFQRQSKYKKNPVLPLRLTLEPGQGAHFRFLVVVYEGIRTKEQMEERFKAFVK